MSHVKPTPHQHTIHDRIEKLLKRGIKVESRAMGRMGWIVEIFDGDVLIRSRRCAKRRRCDMSTGFLRGDPVVLVKRSDGSYLVKNPDRDVERAFDRMGRADNRHHPRSK